SQSRQQTDVHRSELTFCSKTAKIKEVRLEIAGVEQDDSYHLSEAYMMPPVQHALKCASITSNDNRSAETLKAN
ncbi:hypothetical protein CSKR_105581, partial [Clonorchis sinensis]